MHWAVRSIQIGIRSVTQLAHNGAGGVWIAQQLHRVSKKVLIELGIREALDALGRALHPDRNPISYATGAQWGRWRLDRAATPPCKQKGLDRTGNQRGPGCTGPCAPSRSESDQLRNWRTMGPVAFGSRSNSTV